MEADKEDLRNIIQELRVIADSMPSRVRAPMPHLQMEQLEAYISLVSFLQPRFPFPAIDKRAIAPELALLLASKIIEQKPSLMLEMGSGISTVIGGYCLQKNDFGKLISIEHDRHFADQTRSAIRLHGLTDFVEVVYAPLRQTNRRNDEYFWYDPFFLETISPRSVDLLFIDGPPGRLRKLSRYPAIPFLYETLSDDAVILVDDANRNDESEMINLWLRDFPSLRCTYIKKGKGSAILINGDQRV